ncbi:MAG: hypothetical protein ACKO3K_00980 [Cuspidothrix sp.]
MKNKPRKRRLKLNGVNQTHQGLIKSTVQKKPQPSQWRSLLSSTLALSLLFSIAGAIIGFGWISVLFILDPAQVSWLNEYLPQWAKISTGKREIPETLTAIERSLSKKKRIAGETIPLNIKSEEYFLMPIFQERVNCKSNCQQLVELQIYQRSQDLEYKFQTEKYYYLISKLPIIGLAKKFVDSSKSAKISEVDNEQAKIHLPLTTIKAFTDTNSPGFWFYLEGKYQQDNNIIYGQVVHYNPTLKSLQQMLSWKTNNGKLPKWQQVTGNDRKELVIDQTVDLEPNFQVYQVKPSQLVANSVYLEEINFQKSAVNEFAFQQSIFLARNGLWTPALTWLKSIEKDRKQPFIPAAKAQIDVIKLYSNFTKNQAEKNWASPSQQVIADIIDGRWEQGLQVFMKSPNNAEEIANLIQTDKGRIWNRATVALRLNPNRRAVLAWVALIFKVQRGEERTNSWLQSQSNIDGETLKYIQGILAKLDNEINNVHKSRIIGAVKQINQINERDWLPISLETDLKNTLNETSYEVKVSAFHNGTSWLFYPFVNFDESKNQPGKFWRHILGISSDPTIQIIVWKPNGQQEIIAATIKAVQVQNQGLHLLISGPKLPDSQIESVHPQPLALTVDALEWVQPSPVSLKDLSPQKPELVKSILPTIWQTLQHSGDTKVSAVPNLQEMETQMADWPVQLVSLTNEKNQQVMMTISAEAIAALNQSNENKTQPPKRQKQPRTLIFAADGKVIYSDFDRQDQQTLIAIAQLTDDQSLALLVETKRGYSLQRWSQTNQQFQ